MGLLDLNDDQASCSICVRSGATLDTELKRNYENSSSGGKKSFEG